MQKKKGFTLIELVVVMAILAILSTTAIVSYRLYINKAKLQCIKSEGDEIFRAAVWSYESNNCEIDKTSLQQDLKSILSEKVTIEKTEEKNLYVKFIYEDKNYRVKVDLNVYKYTISNESEIIYES